LSVVPIRLYRPQKDHISALARLATAKQGICHEQPSWTLELLTALCAVLAIALLVVAAELYAAAAERDENAVDRDFWLEAALAEDKRTAVIIDINTDRFECRNFNVRREWEVAVAAECQVMGSLLHMARAAH
jgi:hypothetical protein